MTIEIHHPELIALIQHRMESGRYPTSEDALLEANLWIESKRASPLSS